LRPLSNKVAAVWLLRGRAGASMVSNCDSETTTPYCSIAITFFDVFDPLLGHLELGSGSSLAEK
jgi:hypothetical protein